MVVRGFVYVEGGKPPVRADIPVYAVYGGKVIAENLTSMDGSFVLIVRGLSNGTEFSIRVGEYEVRKLVFSPGAVISVGTLKVKDALRPSRPKIVEVRSGIRWVFVRWSHSSDDVAVSKYVVSIRLVNVEKYVSSIEVSSKKTSVNLSEVPPGIYLVEVQAIDVANRASDVASARVVVYPEKVVVWGKVVVRGPRGQAMLPGLSVRAYVGNELVNSTVTMQGGWYSLTLPGEKVFGKVIKLVCRDSETVITINRTKVKVDLVARDYTAPTPPANLIATYIGDAVIVKWSPSVDDVALGGYYVEFRSKLVFTNATSVVIKCGKLIPGKYVVRVWAMDAVGNNSTAAVTHVYVEFPHEKLLTVVSILIVAITVVSVLAIVLRYVATKRAERYVDLYYRATLLVGRYSSLCIRALSLTSNPLIYTL